MQVVNYIVQDRHAGRRTALLLFLSFCIYYQERLTGVRQPAIGHRPGALPAGATGGTLVCPPQGAPPGESAPT